MEVEEAEHAELGWRVDGPVWFGFEDGDGVDVVKDKLHAEEHEEKADGVHECALFGDAREDVALLIDIVVEGENWSCEVEW